jgi:hypothetical protein
MYPIHSILVQGIMCFKRFSFWIGETKFIPDIKEERKLDQKTQQGINNLERKVTPKELTTQKDTEKQKKTPTSH